MMAQNRISVIIDVATKNAESALKNFTSGIKEADGATGKLKAGFTGGMDAIKSSGLAAGAAFGVLVGGAQKAISAASALNESANAVNVSFGEASDEVNKLGENSVNSMGLSERAFNEAAVGMSAFAKTIAGEGGDVAGKLDELMVRGTDFASVMNLEVSEAMDVFRSGLSGETEPLKKFGIDLSAAAVEAYALSSGLVENKKDLTESMKVQARYGLLMERTSNMAGDFAKTSDGLANSQRKLTANIENLQAEIGQNLIPVVEDATGGLNDLFGVWKALSNSGPVKLVLQLVGEDTMLGGLDKILGFAKGVPGASLALGTLSDTWTKLNNVTHVSSEQLAINKMALDDEARSLVQASIDAAFLERKTLDVARAAEGQEKQIEGATRQTDAWADALDAAGEAWDTLTGKLDANDAIRNTASQFDDLEDAALLAWDATVNNADDAVDKQRAYQQAVDDTKRQVYELSEQLGLVPTEVTTQIDALIDEGKFSEAERRIAALTVARTLYIDTVNRGGVFQSSQAGVKSHDGSIVGGQKFGGLRDDEVPMILQKGQAVLTEGQQEAVASAMAGGGGGGITITGNVILPNVKTPEDFVRDLREYARRNGPIQGIT